MSTSPGFVIGALILAVSMTTLSAQTARLRMLAGNGERTWKSVHVQATNESISTGERRLTLRENGTLTMHEGEIQVHGRWELDPDGSAILVTERFAGDWHNTDTMWMDIVDVGRREMTLDYGTGFGHLRVRYELFNDPDAGSDTAGFAAFIAEFRTAVAKRDKKKVASMTHFPFFSHDLPGFIKRPKHGPSFTRDEFLRYYDRLFTSTARKLIAVSTPTPMTGDGDSVRAFAIGIRRSGSSVIWVEFSRNDAGAWKLVGTDNVSE